MYIKLLTSMAACNCHAKSIIIKRRTKAYFISYNYLKIIAFGCKANQLFATNKIKHT